jgi:hypothetical protein
VDALRVIGDVHGATWIENGLRGELGMAVLRAGATVVVFDVERFGEGPVLERAQRALDAAEAALPADVARPVYVGIANAGELLHSGEWPFSKFDPPPGPIWVRPRGRGILAGFFAIGEGGATFLGADRSISGARPPVALVSRWLRALEA